MSQPDQAHRRTSRPGASEGPLSPRFPEVDVAISASFAHNAGMISRVDRLAVGGDPCQQADILQALVALRDGWTADGGRTDADVVATMTAFVDDWDAVFENSGRLTAVDCPPSLASLLARVGIDYHPPQVAIYPLDNGERVVTHAYFKTWDGGNHGRQFAYAVEAFTVDDGVRFALAPRTLSGGLGPRPVLQEPTQERPGPRPIDPKVPRPFRLTL